MVRFLRKGQSWDKSLQDRSMFDIQGLQARSMRIEAQEIGSELNRSENTTPNSRVGRENDCPRCGADQSGPISDIEQMKERFAKLLLGEDMSGCGKGVSSALALSNAITNLAASVFGEQSRLEPMPLERKVRWRREIDLLLSVTDHIVEFVPSQQVGKDGTSMEIMTTKQRKDLIMNIPALRKLDVMLLGYLDNFKDHNEFWYVKRKADESERNNAQGKDGKWWLPTVKVPPNGLSEISRKWLHFQKESVNQVLKASLAINAQVLMEMEIPEAYIESLPKNGRASLGDSLYRSISAEYFDPEQMLASLDLSTEHKVLDLKNRIEASVVIWKRKMINKESKSWSSGVSLEKREQFEERAWTILHILKHRFPGIPQSALEISKIQFNRDVGQSVLESYSRIIESLAYTVMSRIEDVLYADQVSQDLNNKNSNWKPLLTDSDSLLSKKLDVEEEIEKLEFMEKSSSMTLSDFMDWTFENETESEKKEADGVERSKIMKPPNVVILKKLSFAEKLDDLGSLRSPTARH